MITLFTEREDAKEDQKGQTHGRVASEAPADPCRGLYLSCLDP